MILGEVMRLFGLERPRSVRARHPARRRARPLTRPIGNSALGASQEVYAPAPKARAWGVSGQRRYGGARCDPFVDGRCCCERALSAFVLVGLGVAEPDPRHRTGPFAHGAHHAMSLRKARAIARHILAGDRDPANQYLAIPATKRRIGARVRAERWQHSDHDAGPALRRTRLPHLPRAQRVRGDRLGQRARRAPEDAAVKQIVPDTIVQLPAPINAPSAPRGPLRAQAPTTPSGQTLCPSRPRASRCSSPRRCRPRTPRSTTPTRPRRRTSPTARA